MSKFEQAIETYKKSLSEKLNKKNVNEELLRAVAKSCGPAIYRADAAKVACSDKKELKKIKQNFLIKKLGIKDDPSLDKAIEEVCSEMGSRNRNKWRVVFYYLLVEKFEKQGVFGIPVSSNGEDKKSSAKARAKKSSSKKSYKMESKPSSELIHDHALYAAGVGFIPIPVVDLAGISFVQYKMIEKLANQYSHVSFSESKLKSLMAAITGGVSSFELGIFARLLFKGVPLFGPLVGGTAMSGFAYFSTKIIGEIFDDHFSSGGDLSVEDLTVQKMRDLFKFEMKKGKRAE